MAIGRPRKRGPVNPGSTEHLVLLAARASGRIESAALAERFGFYPSNAVTNLARAGFLERTGPKETVLILTPSGRASCPPRRAIPLSPLYP